MSFSDKTNVFAIDHLQLWQLCNVIQSDLLTVYHSATQLFSSVQFSISDLHQLE